MVVQNGAIPYGDFFAPDYGIDAFAGKNGELFRLKQFYAPPWLLT